MTERGEVTAYFHEHVGDVIDGCMIWPYSTNTAGYGHMKIGGQLHMVHDLACEAHHGPRPPGMQAAHGPCHNRRCWNGQHVSWKTGGDNQRDRERDGTLCNGGAVDFDLELTKEVRASGPARHSVVE